MSRQENLNPTNIYSKKIKEMHFTFCRMCQRKFCPLKRGFLICLQKIQVFNNIMERQIRNSTAPKIIFHERTGEIKFPKKEDFFNQEENEILTFLDQKLDEDFYDCLQEIGQT